APGTDAPADLLHHKCLPRSDLGRVPRAVVDEVFDEGQASAASIDVSAELGIERDGSVQQERRHRLVLETACDCKRFVDGGQLVSVLVERRADDVDVAKRRKELERARKQAFPPKELQQPLARELRRHSYTHGITTAPASISNSAHAERVKCSSLIGSKLSPYEPVATHNT